MKLFNRSNLRITSFTLLLATLSACSGTTTETAGSTTAVQTSGETITIYSGRNETLMSALFTQFSNETGVKLEVRYGDSGELAALLLTEGDKSPADIFFAQDAGALGAVESAGLLSPLPSDVTDAVDAKFRSKNGKWVATSGRARVLIYNPDLVASPPASLDDLLDPKFEKKIGYAPSNASWQSFVTALRLTRGEAGARAWLTGLAANKPIAYEKNGAVRDAVNSGEISLGLINHYYLYELISKIGADKVVAKNHFFKDRDAGSLVNIAGVGVLASSKKTEAALSMVRYLLSVAGQSYFAGKTFEYPMTPGVIQFVSLPSLTELNSPPIDLADLKTIEETQELLESVGLLTK